LRWWVRRGLAVAALLAGDAGKDAVLWVATGLTALGICAIVALEYQLGSRTATRPVSVTDHG
jgi:hypothetical protein